MPWIKQKTAFKVVTGKNCSIVSPRLRGRSLCHQEKNKIPLTGRVLTYKIGETVKSPNGICSCQEECCKGIHAYQTLVEARRYARSEILNEVKIVKVSAEAWWRPRYSNKIRAEEVTVLEEVQIDDH